MHGPSYVISTAAFVNLGPARILSAMEESCYTPIDCERVHSLSTYYIECGIRLSAGRLLHFLHFDEPPGHT